MHCWILRKFDVKSIIYGGRVKKWLRRGGVSHRSTAGLKRPARVERPPETRLVLRFLIKKRTSAGEKYWEGEGGAVCLGGRAWIRSAKGDMATTHNL